MEREFSLAAKFSKGGFYTTCTGHWSVSQRDRDGSRVDGRAVQSMSVSIKLVQN